MSKNKNIVLIDPGLREPSVASWNKMVKCLDKLKITFHLPAMFRPETLKDEEINNIAGVIILGSMSSVNDNLQWQNDINTWLDKIFAKATIPVLGICFGHQLLAKYFGGTIARTPTGEHFKKLREINFENHPPFIKRTGHVIVSHGDVVNKKPKDMQVFASSTDVDIEALVHKTLPVWSFQSHPEATMAFLKAQSIPCTQKDLDKSIGWEIMQEFFNYLENKNTP